MSRNCRNDLKSLLIVIIGVIRSALQLTKFSTELKLQFKQLFRLPGNYGLCRLSHHSCHAEEEARF